MRRKERKCFKTSKLKLLFNSNVVEGTKNRVNQYEKNNR